MSMLHMFDLEPVDLDTDEGSYYQHLCVARDGLIEEGVLTSVPLIESLMDIALEAVLATRYGKMEVKQ